MTFSRYSSSVHNLSPFDPRSLISPAVINTTCRQWSACERCPAAKSIYAPLNSSVPLPTLSAADTQKSTFASMWKWTGSKVASQRMISWHAPGKCRSLTTRSLADVEQACHFSHCLHSNIEGASFMVAYIGVIAVINTWAEKSRGNSPVG